MALDPKKIPKLFDISKALEVKSPSTSILWCNNCNKKDHYPNNGFTCSQCSYIIHVKCSKDASKKNSCLNEIFPYRKIDYEEILDLSYNSNYECNCSQFNKNNILEICTKKLLNLKELNFKKILFLLTKIQILIWLTQFALAIFYHMNSISSAKN